MSNKMIQPITLGNPTGFGIIRPERPRPPMPWRPRPNWDDSISPLDPFKPRDQPKCPLCGRLIRDHIGPNYCKLN